VDVVNAIGEGANEFHVIDTLVAKMRGIKVEAESLVAVYGFDGALC